MVASWIEEELATADLNDARLNRRFDEVLNALSGHLHASIPSACGGGSAETTAAYRFFDNDKVTFDGVLAPHIEATRKRIPTQPLVILAQDTTEINLTRPTQPVVGAGPLDEGSRRGLLLHELHAFTPDGTPLGTVSASCLIREDDTPKSSAQTRAERSQIPIEEKESHRWLETLRTAKETARQIPETQIVCVSDSEADIYEVFAEANAETIPNFAWIIRACQNRSLQKNAKKQDADEVLSPDAKYVREKVSETDVLYTATINVRGRHSKVACETRGRRQPRESRTAEVEVRAACVTIRAPGRPDRKLPDVTVNVVMAREIDPPRDETPVEWMLLTSLPIDTIEAVQRVIQHYSVRWLIEIFFRTLKSGCRVEQRLFEHIDRFLPCLGIYLIISWRTLYVCRLGREMPDVSCEVVFEKAEWKGVYHLVKRMAPPKTPPTLMEMIKLIAQLGGYVNRKRTDLPGPQTVWFGIQRMHDIAACWLAFGPETRG